KCKTVVMHDADGKRVYLSEYIDAMSKVYKAEPPKASDVEAYKAVLKKVKDEFSQKAMDTADGWTLDQMQTRLDMLNQAAYGSENIGKEVATFNQNQAITQAYTEMALDIGATALTFWIPGALEVGGAKVLELLNTGSKTYKVVAAITKAAGYVASAQGGRVVGTALKNSPKMAAVINKSVQIATNAITTGVTVAGAHTLYNLGARMDKNIEAGVEFGKFALVASGLGIVGKVADAIKCSNAVAQQAISMVCKGLIEGGGLLGYANGKAIVDFVAQQKKVNPNYELTAEDFWNVVGSNEAIMNDIILAAMMLITHSLGKEKDSKNYRFNEKQLVEEHNRILTENVERFGENKNVKRTEAIKNDLRKRGVKFTENADGTISLDGSSTTKTTDTKPEVKKKGETDKPVNPEQPEDVVKPDDKKPTTVKDVGNNPNDFKNVGRNTTGEPKNVRDAGRTNTAEGKKDMSTSKSETSESASSNNVQTENSEKAVNVRNVGRNTTGEPRNVREAGRTNPAEGKKDASAPKAETSEPANSSNVHTESGEKASNVRDAGRNTSGEPQNVREAGRTNTAEGKNDTSAPKAETSEPANENNVTAESAEKASNVRDAGRNTAEEPKNVREAGRTNPAEGEDAAKSVQNQYRTPQNAPQEGTAWAELMENVQNKNYAEVKEGIKNSASEYQLNRVIEALEKQLKEPNANAKDINEVIDAAKARRAELQR
ncbi:hypothetical protein IKQ21_02910, partial [bacterium]|nr:hypothetical protein [bacterium]